ncbi:hypothetical protein DESA109040_08795 [Deinococcus saxicola]|uniref:hypothetical protein n=1 Tax=Deinococcus saxicola TaxID=249406 RepID=UPI0039EFCF8B
MAALHGQMRAEHLKEVWVLADNPEAQTFHKSCGYAVDALRGAMLSHTVSEREA